VENDCFHSLDVQWREDAPAICTKGKALLSLGMLRVLAYNWLQHLRCRHVRVLSEKIPEGRPMPWEDIFLLVSDCLRSLFPLPVFPARQAPGAAATRGASP
jgi:hypothetical protein